MTRADKFRQQAIDVVRPALQSGETVEAALPYAQIERAAVVTGLGPEADIIKRVAGRRNYPIVVTARRVFLVECTALSKPRAILAEFPRSQVQVARCEHHPAPAHDTLVLALPGAGDVKFIVHRSARGDLDALNQVLGGPASS